jgi:hydroxyacylglutathione hydrolase
MLLERYYDESLAQASYLIACEATREAIIIDPNLVERYEATLASRRLRVRYVTETHIHADYLSGGRQLARAHKAELLLSSHGGADWSYAGTGQNAVRLLRDGDSITVGNIRLDVLHTPGHTPEHICFLVTDLPASDKPMGLISGDFLFVGDVGRPDLLERAAHVAGTMEQSARDLYRSLERLKKLPDYLQVWPGHGAGSACGKALGSLPQTTLGYERLYNPALKPRTEGDFVTWVLDDQPEPPRYFARMKRLNRDGAPEVDGAASRPHPAEDIERLLAEGAQVVDVRLARAFAKSHVAGTINVPYSMSFVTYAGTVLDSDHPLAVIGQGPEQALQVTHALALIGVTPAFGAPGVIEDIALRGRVPMATLPTVEAAALADQSVRNGMTVIDVRGSSEWRSGHLAGAEHIFLGDLVAKASMPRDSQLVVHCQSGTRSSIAASLLMREGFTNVTNFAGGYDAWEKAGLPVVRDDR